MIACDPGLLHNDVSSYLPALKERLHEMVASFNTKAYLKCEEQGKKFATCMPDGNWDFIPKGCDRANEAAAIELSHCGSGHHVWIVILSVLGMIITGSAVYYYKKQITHETLQEVKFVNEEVREQY